MSYSFIQNKLPAFTLMELIVSMIVSTLVLAIIFTAWHIVSRQSDQFSMRSQNNRDKSLLHSFLVLDTESADSVFKTGGEILCYVKSGNEFRLNISYTLREQFVTRASALSTDTFFVDSFSFTLPTHAGDQP